MNNKEIPAPTPLKARVGIRVQKVALWPRYMAYAYAIIMLMTFERAYQDE
jgi:hypothetical protein